MGATMQQNRLWLTAVLLGVTYQSSLISVAGRHERDFFLFHCRKICRQLCIQW